MFATFVRTLSLLIWGIVYFVLLETKMMLINLERRKASNKSESCLLPPPLRQIWQIANEILQRLHASPHVTPHHALPPQRDICHLNYWALKYLCTVRIKAKGATQLWTCFGFLGFVSMTFSKPSHWCCRGPSVGRSSIWRAVYTLGDAHKSWSI